MFELIALGAAGLTGIVTHQSTKDYVRRRLRFTSWVENGATIGLVAGAAAGIVTAVAIPVIPFIGLGTGILVGTGAGVGVGTGIATGAWHARKGYLPDAD